MTECDVCGEKQRYAWQAAMCCDPITTDLETVD